MSQHAYEELGRIWLFVAPVVLMWAYIRVLRRRRPHRLTSEDGSGPATDPQTIGTSGTTRIGTSCFWVAWLLFLAITCYLTGWRMILSTLLALAVPIFAWVALVRLTPWPWVKNKWTGLGLVGTGLAILFYLSF